MELLEPIEFTDKDVLLITGKSCKYCKEVYPIIEEFCNKNDKQFYKVDIQNFLFDEFFDTYKITKIPVVYYNKIFYIGKDNIISRFN
jgi:thiol-disulfide isomerase/thioredoxin